MVESCDCPRVATVGAACSLSRVLYPGIEHKKPEESLGIHYVNVMIRQAIQIRPTLAGVVTHRE